MQLRPSTGRPPATRAAGSLVAACALFGAVLAACGSAGTSGTTITLYNGQHLQLTTQVVDAFTAATGIHVRIRSNDGVVLADQLLQEGSRTPADAYLTENSPELTMLSQHHLLAPLPSSVLNQIPSRYDSPRGDWVGIALRVGALAYNPSMIRRSRLPAKLLDLSKPEWKGKVAIAPTDSDFVPLVGAVIATDGKSKALSWLQGLKRNAELYSDDESVVAAVNRGAAALGIINQYYWYRLKLEVGSGQMHSKLYFFPNRDVGGVENISGIAVTASSKHKVAADKLAAFFVSAKAQRILAAGDDFEYPARPGIAPNPALTPLSKVDPAAISVVKLGDDLPAATLLQQAGLT